MSQICLWFHVIVKALFCQDDRELVALKSLSCLPQNGTRSLRSQSVCRILDHVGHDKCTLLEHTEIAAHMSNMARARSLSGSGPIPSDHTTQMYFLQFPPFWFGSICSHSTRGWGYYWTPKVEEVRRLVTSVKCWIYIKIPIAKTQEF